MKLFEFLSVIPYILKTEMKIYKTYPVEEKKFQTTIIIELYKIKAWLMALQLQNVCLEGRHIYHDTNYIIGRGVP